MEKAIDIHFTIDIPKPKYRNCGHFCIIFLLKYLNAYTTQTYAHIINFNARSKTGFLLPSQIATILNNFMHNRGGVKIGKYDEHHIKQSIHNNKPILQFIAHGYSYNKNNAIKWNIIKGIFLQHYIIIVGYDQQGWICYDPAFDNTANTYVHVSYALMDKAVRRSGLGIFYNGWNFR